MCKLKERDFIKEISSDIVCLLETKVSKEDSIVLEGYSLLKSVNRVRTGKGIYGGIILYCKPPIKTGIEVLKTSSTEYLWVKLKKSFFNMNNDVYICFLYNPPSNSSMSKSNINKADVLENIENEVIKYSRIGDVMSMCDFNAHILIY